MPSNTNTSKIVSSSPRAARRLRERSQCWIAIGFGIFASFLHTFIQLWVNNIQSTPLVDEIFHARQGAAYCARPLHEWPNIEYDAAITTPPGLYWMSAIFLKLLPEATGPTSQLFALRLLNSVFFGSLLAIVNTMLCYDVHAKPLAAASKKSDETSEMAWRKATPMLILRIASLAFFPLSFFFHFLYYTDSLSQLALSAAYLATRNKCFHTAAGCLAFAVLCRQVNIVWGAYLGVFALVLVDDKIAQFVLEGRYKALPTAAVRGAFLHARKLSGFYLVAAAFLVYMWWNDGSIVLGHKLHHSVSLHLAQMVYLCIGCIAVIGAPALSRARSQTTSRIRFAVGGLLTTLSFVCLRHGSIAHPFLLADNRHISSVIWRKVLRHPIIRQLCVPLGIGGAILVAPQFIDRIRATFRETLPQVLAFIFFSSVALVPSPLLELRYFTIPLILLVLHTPVENLTEELLRFALFAGCNIGLFLIFGTRSWIDGEGLRARMIP